MSRPYEMAGLAWRGSPTRVSESQPRSFTVECGGRRVPGAVWSPASAGRRAPTVLLGHGGSSDKLSARNRRLAGLLTAEGLVAVAIDGPFHGERVSTPMPPEVYQALIVAEGASTVSSRMTADWLASLHSLEAAGLVSDDPVGYIGVSMGARYGLPLAAALGPRLGVFVIGGFGLEQTLAMDARLHVPEDISRFARAVAAPTLMHVQWDDSVFPRAGQLALFDTLAAGDKRLLAFPGEHTATPLDAERAWIDFVVAHLAGESGSNRSQDGPRPVTT